MKTFIPCPSCDGRKFYTLDNPNDPCARLYRCEDCIDTNGAARCSECANEAVDAWIEGRHVTPLCGRHMELWRAEAAA